MKTLHVNQRLGQIFQPGLGKFSSTHSRIKRTGWDPLLGFSIAGLLLVGIVMVYSASAVYAMEKYDDPYFFIKRQALWMALGAGVMLYAANMDYRKFQRLTYPIMALTFLFLIAVMIPGLSKEVGGARRWLSIGGLAFQPSELAKFALVLFIAKSLVKRKDLLKNFTYGYLPKLIVLGFFFLLILFQPDFGTAMIIAGVAFLMFFVGGVRFKFLFYSCLALIPLLVTAVMNAEYRRQRILAFLDPWQDPAASGFQAIQSFYAFGRGGYWGLGLGGSKQKLFYLPEAHTDFIFAVIGEELGFIGTTAIVILFGIVMWRGFSAALRVNDSFGSNLAVGLTLLIVFQAFTNMAVTVGLLPTKGLTLPFISSGGSSLVMSMLCMGVLLNISEHAVKRR